MPMGARSHVRCAGHHGANQYLCRCFALSRTTHPAASSLLHLHLRLARAPAALGERRATLRSLGTAERLLDLGDITQAHSLISEGQALLPTSCDKKRGIFVAYRAHGHLSRREPEAAAADALGALHLAERIGAPRCVQLVRDLAPAFAPYQTAEGVPELLQATA